MRAREQRSRFRMELGRLEALALDAFDLAVQALDSTMEAIETGDRELAEIVMREDDRIDARYREVHKGLLTLLARQSPAAGDLRLVAALFEVIKNIERIGDQCVNMCKLLPMSGTEVRLEPRLLQLLARMGLQARSQLTQSKQAFASRNAELAEDLARQDAQLNALNRECFRAAIELGADPLKRQTVMHAMLVARALERVGDNAVDIGEQTAFLTTGLFREFTDASQPKVASSSETGS